MLSPFFVASGASRLWSFVALLVAALGASAVLASPACAADDRDVWVLPTEMRAAAGAPVDLAPLARRLDQVLQEAVRDFGMTPRLGEPPLAARDEPSLTELARDASVLAPELGLDGSELELRLTMVPRASRVLLVRVQHIDPSEVEVKSLGMLRELLEPSFERVREDCPPALGVANGEAHPAAYSEGRVVLALHSAALGGYLGFALQRASGSDDARLTYPLAALGAAVGVGAAVIVADEWDIDVSRAWFLGASIVWPGVGTQLLVDADGPESPGRRYLLGILGSVGGLTLATAGLALGDMSEGGAALTHSGAVMGLLLGGLGEMTIRGDAELTPRRGMGIGSLGGVLIAGALATQLEVPSSTDVLAIDLSALLGGLTGAALGTPVLVSQDESPARDRIWLSGIMLGTVVGAGLSYWITQSEDEPAAPAEPSPLGSGVTVMPQIGWMGRPLGFGVSGSW
ncbi:MAG TPA: hypothetical protein VMG12_12805 [Polyangiaceae bacterium]|nr:hypothetical protein [Polyangiaceae bacterium]